MLRESEVFVYYFDARVLLCCRWEFSVVVLLDMNVFFKCWAIELVSDQFPPNTIKVIREFERIQKKICRHKMSIMFNEICINEEMLPIYIYVVIFRWHFFISRCYPYRWVAVVSWLNNMITAVDLWGSTVKRLMMRAVDPPLELSTLLHIHTAATHGFCGYALLWFV